MRAFVLVSLIASAVAFIAALTNLVNGHDRREAWTVLFACGWMVWAVVLLCR